MAKIIGLLGGLSYVSSIEYYRNINEGVNKILGESNSAECLLYSLNYQELANKGLLNSYDILYNASAVLKAGGASAIAICSNTPHVHINQLIKEIDLPFINIITETGKAISKLNIQKIGLIGTKNTMELDFYKVGLESLNIKTVIPSKKAYRNYINETIQKELSRGILKETTKKTYLAIINNLIANGAKGIIFGCTEIPLLLTQEDIPVPIFDTTKIHSKAIIEYLTT